LLPYHQVVARSWVYIVTSLVLSLSSVTPCVSHLQSVVCHIVTYQRIKREGIDNRLNKSAIFSIINLEIVTSQVGVEPHPSLKERFLKQFLLPFIVIDSEKLVSSSEGSCTNCEGASILYSTHCG
jgi:hypothetical protein